MVKLESFFEFFRLWRFWCQGEKQWIFKKKFVFRCCLFDWNLDGGKRTCGGWEIKVSMSVEISKNRTLWNIWTVTNTMRGSKQKVCWLNRLSQTENVRWRLWLEDHFCCYWEMWVLLSRQIKKIKQFLNVLSTGIMMEESEICVFNSNLLHNVRLSIGTSMQEI